MTGNGARPAPDATAVHEVAVLAACVASVDAAREAAAILESRHFRHPDHQAVFAAAVALASAAEPVVEPAAVIAQLGRDGRLAGERDLAGFVRALNGHGGQVSHHAPGVLAAWQQRNLRGVLAAAADLAEGSGYDPAVTPGVIRALVEDAATVTGPQPLRTQAELLNEVLSALDGGQDPSLPTGYPELDDAIGGLGPGRIIIIAARPGIGKTLIALCIAEHVASVLGLPVLYSSLEMDAAGLTHRRISAATGVPYRHLDRYQLTGADWDRIGDQHGIMSASRLRIDDDDEAGIPQIRGRLQEMIRAKAPARLHILDYLGIMPAPRAESRQQAVAALAREYRRAMKAFGVPGILLCQLNRNPEHRKDSRPQLSDLRETGELEQIADAVLLLHRDQGAAAERSGGDMDVIIAKNRRGPCCTVTLRFQAHLGRIISPAAEWSPSDQATLDGQT